MLLDTEGFCIPFTDDDAVIEVGLDDPEYGEPESWPEWVDAERWEPTEADVAWINDTPVPAICGAAPFEPSDADLDEMAAWSEHLDRLDTLRRADDAEDECRMRYGGASS
jgi:hypothetical protein